ncbi:hypothetical protein CQA28_25420, partial [Citrobacter freundii]
PTTSPRSQPVAAATSESLNISCEVPFRHASLLLNGAIIENILNLLRRELESCSHYHQGQRPGWTLASPIRQTASTAWRQRCRRR